MSTKTTKRPGAQIVPGIEPGTAFVQHNNYEGWGYGYFDRDDNITSTPTPMTWDEATLVVSIPDPATRATGDDLPAAPTCPLHGEACPVWAAL